MAIRHERIGLADLYCADCFDILPELAGKEMDALITDMPYGCTMCDWDKPIDLAAYWPLAIAACKQNAAHVHFCQTPFAFKLYESNPKMFRYDLVYCKRHSTGFLNARRMPLRQHELVFVFYKSLPFYQPQMKEGKAYVKKRGLGGACYHKLTRISVERYDGRFPTSLIAPDKDRRRANLSQAHNTEKNINCLDWLVKTYTDTGHSVIDPFMGGGTTGVAAVQNGRRFIGIELYEKWFDLACERIAKAQAQQNLMLETA